MSWNSRFWSGYAHVDISTSAALRMPSVTAFFAGRLAAKEAVLDTVNLGEKPPPPDPGDFANRRSTEHGRVREMEEVVVVVAIIGVRVVGQLCAQLHHVDHPAVCFRGDCDAI